MLAPQSLAKRIVAAFVLMTAAVAGLFSLSISYAIDEVELRLVSDSLNRHLDFLIDQMRAGRRPVPGPGMALHVAPLADRSSLPAWLRPLEPGLHEELSDDEAYHVMVRDGGGQRFVLVLDQEDFERREQLLFDIVAIGFGLSIVVAWALGKGLARTVIAPVVRLSGQVQ